jgi:hypothetical protein
LKKCIPITLSGRDAPRQRGVGPTEDLFLDGSVLDDRLDHEIRRNEIVDGRHARQHLVGIGAAFLRKPRQTLFHRRPSLLGCAGLGVVQRHPAT